MRLCSIVLAVIVAISAPSRGQIYKGREVVKATLIADVDAVVPGRTFTAGLLLKMEPGWHSYWRYSGDSGLPTTIAWTLPPGFKAGEIQWPIPEKVIEEGDLETYAYHDEVMLLVEITPPQKIDAQRITLAAKASWLVCEKLCLPGGAELALALPVAAQNQPANTGRFEKYRARLPKLAPPFKYEWSSQLGQAALAVFGVGNRTLDFFPMPAAGMAIGHPTIVPGEPAQITVPVTSGPPDQLTAVLVLGDDATREGWLIAPQTSAPPNSFGASIRNPKSEIRSLFRYLLLGFVGGLLLNVMPCVLPVITLKIYGFINQAGQSRRRIFELGLAYCAGVFAWFLGLAALIVLFGLNWSFQFQNKGFIAAMLVICLVFGMNLLGAFEFFLPANLNSRIVALASKEGFGGAFVHGLFTTLMGSACTAPLLGPAIGFALAQPPPIIFSFFATIAAGMALPYFLLTLNPGWMRFLPKPGMWMVRVKQVMGALVLATAVWFGYVLWQQLSARSEAFAPAFEAALKTERTVFVDFTAEWCINCKVNEKVVLKSDAVQQAFKAGDVLLLKADWTNGDPDITKLLKRFGRGGVPAYVIYPAHARERPIVLPELLTQQIVLDALSESQRR